MPLHHLLAFAVDNKRSYYKLILFSKKSFCILGFLKIFRNISGPRPSIHSIENSEGFFNWTYLSFNSGKFSVFLFYIYTSNFFHSYFLLLTPLVMYWTSCIDPPGLLFFLYVLSLLLLFSCLGDFFFFYFIFQLHWVVLFHQLSFISTAFLSLYLFSFLIKPFSCLAKAMYFESLRIQIEGGGCFFHTQKKCSLFPVLALFVWDVSFSFFSYIHIVWSF